MYYYVSAWNKLSKIANIFTASWEFLCMAGSSSSTYLDFREVPICGDLLCEIKACSQRIWNALNIICKIWVSMKQVPKWISFGNATVLHSLIQFFKIVFKNDFPLICVRGQSQCHLLLSILQSILLRFLCVFKSMNISLCVPKMYR